MNQEPELKTIIESHIQCVQNVPIFNHLKEEQMAEVMNVAKQQQYKKGEIIFRAGESADSLYIVNRGKVKISRIAENGKEQLVRILKRGDFTGELAIFRQHTYENYAEAILDTSFCVIHQKDIYSLLQKYPSISLKILEEFSSRLAESEKNSASFTSQSVERRIAIYLLELMDEGNYYLQLPMSRKDLASYLGTTPETFSRKLKKFEEAGWIKQITKKEIRVLNKDLLEFSE
ncbi:Crp/Fnr family transcriptional regulator [Lacticigenium naphthae]|uniref:Crp/Fnr family transcriptional regulator n=1 Tax=Lacticigenium naphthae TaxID=515351 RepID=UPI000421E2FD|nr:Crp/Fnr family transcriptional regulator [Lacticigenium naphthae]